MIVLPAYLQQEIAEYKQKIRAFRNNSISETEFKSIRVPMGVYEQRTNGTFMVRIRCTGGFISPLQLKQIGEIAILYNSELLHITTRQEIQIQNLTLEHTAEIIQKLYDIGISTRGGGGNTVRNIMTSVDAGISEFEIFDVYPYTVALTNYLIAQSDSWTLPRKFKIAFSGCESDNAYAMFNDLGFIAKIQNGIHGFSVYIGGSLSSSPMIGEQVFDFIPAEEVIIVSEAVKKIFSQHGNRRNKHKARLRFLFYKYGKTEVFNWIYDLYNTYKKQDFEKLIPIQFEFIKFPIEDHLSIETANEDFLLWKKRYVTVQKQNGYVSICIPFEHGNIKPIDTIELAEFVSKYGNDVLRFSMRQQIFLRNIPEAEIYKIYQFLEKKAVSLSIPFLANNIVSCTGADTCRLGICLAKGASKAIKNQLSKSVLQLDSVSDLRINISGCPNSCGQHTNADIGLYGKVGRTDRMYPAYSVMLGGTIGESNANFGKQIGEINAHDSAKFIEAIVSDYVSKKTEFSNFHEYSESEYPKQILESFENVPNFETDSLYYYDLGSSNIFSLEGRGMGECSAGIFDLIEVDLDIIKKSIENISEDTSKKLYSIAIAASRMLLITKGVEPKNKTEIFDAFITEFINQDLISVQSLPVITRLKNAEIFAIEEYKEEIIHLAKEVENLYSQLNDSLQLLIPKQTETPQVKHEIKDFRGVACPMNFVKTKIELSKIAIGDTLEILLDDGAPIENVPGSVKNEGHKILEINQIDTYWKVTIQKK